MKIVINSSPLIFLGKLEFLELFLETEDEFYVPTAVIEEIQMNYIKNLGTLIFGCLGLFLRGFF